MVRRLGLAIPLLAVLALLPTQAEASLNVFQTYVGNYGVSTDGFGSTSQSGVISAEIPAGATVVAAYLYSSTFDNTVTPGGTLNGNAVNYATALGQTGGLQAWRADVTSTVQAGYNGLGGVYNFNVTETQFAQDGEALVVVYSQALIPTTTIGILDGFSAQSGDSTAINFSQPLDPTAPGFVAEMRLGIGFSCCNQESTVTVNGTVITNTAGNEDDSGQVADGALITVGGFDDPFSPFLPSYTDDHERYNLVPQIHTGDTSIHVQTVNPSHDDNIFLAVFRVSGEGGVNAPAPNAADVPEPASMTLLGLGLGAAAIRRRFAKS